MLIFQAAVPSGPCRLFSKPIYGGVLRHCLVFAILMIMC